MWRWWGGGGRAVRGRRGKEKTGRRPVEGSTMMKKGILAGSRSQPALCTSVRFNSPATTIWFVTQSFSYFLPSWAVLFPCFWNWKLDMWSFPPFLFYYYNAIILPVPFNVTLLSLQRREADVQYCISLHQWKVFLPTAPNDAELRHCRNTFTY